MISVVYVTDQNYFIPTCVSIRSVLENTKSEEVEVYVISYQVDEKDLLKLETMKNDKSCINVVRIRDSECISGYKKMPTNRKEFHISETSTLKFDIANLLPDVDKALYLDGDTIVQKDLGVLFDTLSDDMYLAAVPDMGDWKTENSPSYLAERIGIYDDVYFNSGVMLLNLKRIREEGISEALKEYRRNGMNFFMDQDAFNTVFRGRWNKLSFTYNFRTAIFDEYTIDKVGETFLINTDEGIGTCLKQQTILHMCNKMKPWKYNLPWITDIFLKYYQLTPFVDKKLKLESALFEVARRNKFENDRKEWIFPYERIKRGSDIILYGAGKVGRSYAEQLALTKYCRVIAMVDENSNNILSDVRSPEDIATLKYDYIVISMLDREVALEIKKKLEDKGYKNVLYCFEDF